MTAKDEIVPRYVLERGVKVVVKVVWGRVVCVFVCQLMVYLLVCGEVCVGFMCE